MTEKLRFCGTCDEEPRMCVECAKDLMVERDAARNNLNECLDVLEQIQHYGYAVKTDAAHRIHEILSDLRSK